MKEKALRTYAIYEKARDSAKQTDYGISKLTGMRPSTISDWKHGRYTPKHDKLIAISKALNFPVELFYEVE